MGKEKPKNDEWWDAFKVFPLGPKVVTELLIDKGIITRDEIRQKAIKLSGLSEDEFDEKLKVLES